jgi:hypothetical protein
VNQTLRGHLAFAMAALIANGAYGRTYTVGRGDTLSQISQKELGGPVWGNQGTLERVIQLNPQIQNPNLIYPNDVIKLGEDAVVEETPPAPEPQEEPVATSPEAPSEPAESSDSKHRLRILGSIGDTALQARDQDNRFATTLHSKPNVGVVVGWDYSLTPETSIGLVGSIIQSQFASTSDGRFEGIEDTLLGVGAVVNHSFTPRLHGSGIIGVQQFYFLTENDAATLKLEPVFVDHVGLGLGYDVFVGEKITSGIEALTTYALPANASRFDVEPGFTYGGDIYGKYHLSSGSAVIGNVFYDRRVQDTSGTSQRNSDMGMRLGMQFDL